MQGEGGRETRDFGGSDYALVKSFVRCILTTINSVVTVFHSDSIYSFIVIPWKEEN